MTSDKDNPATVTWYYASYHRYYSVGPTGEYDKDYAVAKSVKNDIQNDWGAAFKIKETATDFKAENIKFINSFNVEYTDEERADGVEDTGGGAVTICDEARKTILSQWQNKKQETITHPFTKEKMQWGTAILV